MSRSNRCLVSLALVWQKLKPVINGVRVNLKFNFTLTPFICGDYFKVDNVWAEDVHPTQRGRQIQAELAQTEYSAWGNTDFYKIVDPITGESKKVLSQNFPLVDFHLGEKVVSLKSVNTNGFSWHQNMKDHIEDLANRGILSNGIEVPVANRTLDIRVQPGGLADAVYLFDRAEKAGIKLIIKEYIK